MAQRRTEVPGPAAPPTPLDLMPAPPLRGLRTDAPGLEAGKVGTAMLPTALLRIGTRPADLATLLSMQPKEARSGPSDTGDLASDLRQGSVVPAEVFKPLP